jgi:hypothetical protein
MITKSANLRRSLSVREIHRPGGRMHPPLSYDEEGASAVCLSIGRWMNTKGHKGLEWFRPLERNTLPPLCACSIEYV